MESLEPDANSRSVGTAFAIGFGSSLAGAGMAKVATKYGGQIAIKNLANKSNGESCYILL